MQNIYEKDKKKIDRKRRRGEEIKEREKDLREQRCRRWREKRDITHKHKNKIFREKDYNTKFITDKIQNSFRKALHILFTPPRKHNHMQNKEIKQLWLKGF